MPTVRSVIADLLDRNQPDDVIVADVWNVDDILEHAAAMRRVATREEAEAFLDDIDERLASHDGHAGIDWALIEHYIENPDDF